MIGQSRDIDDAECGEFRLIKRTPLCDDGLTDTPGEIGSPGAFCPRVFDDHRVRFAVDLKGKVLILDNLPRQNKRDEQ
jgi:hypothetical protein